MKKNYMILILFVLILSAFKNGEQVFGIDPDGYKSPDYYKGILIKKILNHDKSINSIMTDNLDYYQKEFEFKAEMPKVVSIKQNNGKTSSEINIDSLINVNFPRKLEDVEVERYKFEYTPDSLKYPAIKSAFRDSVVIKPLKDKYAIALIWELNDLYWHISRIQCIKME